jgi:hypothetical protein
MLFMRIGRQVLTASSDEPKSFKSYIMFELRVKFLEPAGAVLL